jgi:chemotaxis-related protein WspB
VDATQIVEVLPPLRIERQSAVSAGIVGFCNYRGEPVQVLDLCRLLTGETAPDLLSTRMLMVRHPNEARSLALLVPGATDTVRRDPGEFLPTGMAGAQADWLGPVAPDAAGFLQRVDLEGLFRTASMPHVTDRKGVA